MYLNLFLFLYYSDDILTCYKGGYMSIVRSVTYHVQSNHVPEEDVMLDVQSLDAPYDRRRIIPRGVMRLYDNVYMAHHFCDKFLIYVNS